MPKVRSPDCEKAEKLFKENCGKMSLKEIAEKVGVSESTVRSWKNRYKWNATPQKNECNANSKNVAKNKRGGQIGNKNAKGNQNNYRHGIYVKLISQSFDRDELEVYQNMDFNAEERLINYINMGDIQISRFLKDIKKAYELPNSLVLKGMSKTKEDKEKQTIDMTAAYELILKYNDAIEKTKKQNIKCIETIEKLRIERAKGSDKHNEAIEKLDNILEEIKNNAEI